MKTYKVSRNDARTQIMQATINLMKAGDLIQEARSWLQLNRSQANVPEDLIDKLQAAEKLISKTSYNQLEDVQDYLIYKGSVKIIERDRYNI